MEHKLKHAKDELSKIINTKVFSKGNTLIYELDHANRQLRLVKDNVYDMEQKLKDKIRLSFDKDLEQARLELAETRKKFDEYQKTLNSHMKADIQRNINELDLELKRLVQRKDTPIDHSK
jgi:predicted transcriptional regulator